jgi:hypothetical protein
VGLGDRPVDELVMLTLVLGLVGMLLLAGGGIVLLAILRPELDLTLALNNLGSAVTALTGSVLGYSAGRGRRAKQ